MFALSVSNFFPQRGGAPTFVVGSKGQIRPQGVIDKLVRLAFCSDNVVEL